MYELKIVKSKRSPSSMVCEVPNKITRPEDLIPILNTIKDHPQEHFLSITLNGAGEIINNRVITIGLLNSSLVHPREVFRSAILDNAASIIISHNHPSGSLDPSSQDIAITRQLKEAGDLIGIHVLDHIIISKNGHTSLKERGMM